MTITPKNIERLRKAYKVAVEREKETFYFQGEEFHTSYAKYLLEWLETVDIKEL